MITKCGPILKVDDVAATIDYWVERLGFEPGIRAEQDGCVVYGSVRKDAAEVHFGGEGTPPIPSRVFVWIDAGIDDFYHELQERGARVGEPPVVDHWGGRIFTVFDNNGHEVQVLQAQGTDESGSDVVEFQRSIPVLLCRDVVASAAFYTERLGLTVEWENERTKTYAFAFKDTCNVHLAAMRPGVSHSGVEGKAEGEPADVNIMITNIDALYERYAAQGLHTLGEPSDQPYGVRDFTVVDPDGYHIRFNQIL